MNIATWNVEWCGPRSLKFQEIRSRLLALKPSVVCITEATADYMIGGETIRSDADYGYVKRELRRKVILWSQSRWEKVDRVGHEGLPSGRFIYGETENLRIMGICIPWHGAHVSTGRIDRKRWQDHLSYLSILKEVILERQPHIIIGDFNQRVPYDAKYLVPKHVSDCLVDMMNGYDICTAGLYPKLIDHIALADGISSHNRTLIDPDWEGTKLSDDYGAGIKIARMSTPE